MPRTSDKRQRLLAAAKSLFHSQGFLRTTLADIAEKSGVPLGNVYYYFKSKDDIAVAVIDERIEEFQSVIGQWEADPDPRHRLLSFLELPEAMRDAVARHGCPIGGLALELNKESSELVGKSRKIINVHLQWIIKQFRLLDKEEAEELGREFIARLQGAALLANTLGNPEVVREQNRRLRNWLVNV